MLGRRISGLSCSFVLVSGRFRALEHRIAMTAEGIGCFSAGEFGEYITKTAASMVATSILFIIAHYIFHAMNRLGMQAPLDLNNYEVLFGTLSMLTVVTIMVIITAWMIGCLRSSPR
ncbi:hypothetical protein [Acidilobus sp.]|uniref:hypothetical protein n=1 Tax=Acidilobus sp. TaxID=1872109 RepID=UPI003CFDA453